MISIDALVPLLLPSQTDICVEDIVLDDPQHVIIQASASPTTATCPSCGQSTTRIHSRYTRTLADVPWATIAVSLRLHVRKFVCLTPSCSRRIFTERLPSVMMPWSRRTARLAAHQRQIGLVVGSAAGARLGTALDQGTGRTTLLRLMRRAELPEAPAPRVIGIDEFALRKGQQYSTLIVDLERGEVVDVLPDRSEEAVAAWLRAHPGVEVVSRDRATVYAEGTRAGAPDAIQVADRFHLSRNLSEALQRLFDRHPSILRAAAAQLAHDTTATTPTADSTSPDAPSPTDEAAAVLETMTALGEAAAPPPEGTIQPRSHAEGRYQAVKALQQQGLGQRAIARQLQLHRRTVRRYMLAETFPERALGRQSISTVQPYLPYVLQRWAEGCHDRQQLWQELVAQGYTGSYASVCRAVACQPTCTGTTASATPAAPKVRPLSSRQAAWALLRRPEDATTEEEKRRQVLCTFCPDAATAYPLAQRFGQMIRGRQVEELDAWLAEAEASGVPELRSFAMGLRRDYAAVRAALELPWSTGPVEGQINRVKMLKRQTYGRAKFDLLRRRVLLA